MKRLAYFLFFIGITIPAFAEPLTSVPMPTGPYQIGIAKYDVIQEHPNGRLIPLQIYFPIQKGAQHLHPKIFEERAPGTPLNVEVYSQKTDLSLLSAEVQHPLILFNHGNMIAMTEYAYLSEDLASHGYIVVAIQHQLKTDVKEPKVCISRYTKMIDTMLYVFEWLQDNQVKLFNHTLDFNKVGLIGHSMGGKALLLFANQASHSCDKKHNKFLLPHKDSSEVKEALIVLDTGEFPYPRNRQIPLFVLLSEKHEGNQKNSGMYEDMVKIGHKVTYYKGSKHLSFMDLGYIDPPNPVDPNNHYFNGTVKERKAFFDQVRKDIRDFLKENGIIATAN